MKNFLNLNKKTLLKLISDIDINKIKLLATTIKNLKIQKIKLLF